FAYLGKTVTHVYADDGIYTVILTVTDNDGSNQTAITSVIIHNFPPIAYAGTTYSGFEGSSIAFTGSATDPGTTDILTYEWDFTYDDANFSVELSDVDLTHPSYTYADAGTYTVALCVRDDDGGVSELATASVTVNRRNLFPFADAGGPYSGYEGTPITFDASSSSDPEGTPLTYEWDWDNDGTYDAVTMSPTIERLWIDDYIGMVMLRVTDGAGLTATSATELTIYNIAPTAEAGGPYRSIVASSIAFTGSATDPGTMDILTYEWDFDDNGVFDASGKNVFYSYSTPGTYFVTLRVSDDDGGTDYDTTTVTVYLYEMHVEKIEMSKESWKPWKRVRAVAVVTIFDVAGDPVEGATVIGTWSGLVTGSASESTGADGNAIFISSGVSSRDGTCTFTVDDVTKADWIYNPEANKETSDSIQI
ncbi:MAG: PKD domain-containing protein, partial [Candidatus Bathyarchaeota archaeon]